MKLQNGLDLLHSMSMTTVEIGYHDDDDQRSRLPDLILHFVIYVNHLMDDARICMYMRYPHQKM